MSNSCRGLLGGLFFGDFGPFWRPTASASTTNEFLSSSSCFLIPNMMKWAQNWLKWPKLCEIAWKLHENCMQVSEGVCKSLWKYHYLILWLDIMHLDTQHVEIGQKSAQIAKIAWNCVKIAWNWVRECVKVSPLNLSAGACAFWYPICWNWLKNG